MSDDKAPGFDDLMKNLFDGLMASMLQGISESFGKLAILLSSAESHGRDKKNTCVFYRNGICDYWYWEEEPSSEPFIIDVIKKEDGWYIDPHPIYCALCFTYKEKEYEDRDEELRKKEWTEKDKEIIIVDFATPEGLKSPDELLLEEEEWAEEDEELEEERLEEEDWDEELEEEEWAEEDDEE